MSHYATVQARYENKDYLVAALQKVGAAMGKTWKPEYHKTPVNLYGYKGDQRSQVANIVVPRKQVGGLSNDLGFIYDESSNAYNMIISQYDQGFLGGDFLARLSCQYAIAALNAEHGQEFVIEGQPTLMSDGSYSLTLTSVEAQTLLI